MNRRAAIAMLGVALASTLLVVPASAAGAAAPVRITVVGDSLALGVGASDSSRGFTFVIFDRVLARRPGSEITNLSMGGATGHDVTRLQVPRIAQTAPDVVMLCVGGNDAIRRRSPDVFAASYARLVLAIRDAAPHARLIVFNVPDVAVSPIFDDATKPALRRLIGAYNGAIARDARAARATTIDLYRISERARRSDRRFFSGDLFHPSDAGYATIAAAAWPQVAHVLALRV